MNWILLGFTVIAYTIYQIANSRHQSSRSKLMLMSGILFITISGLGYCFLYLQIADFRIHPQLFLLLCFAPAYLKALSSVPVRHSKLVSVFHIIYYISLTNLFSWIAVDTPLISFWGFLFIALAFGAEQLFLSKPIDGAGIFIYLLICALFLGLGFFFTSAFLPSLGEGGWALTVVEGLGIVLALLICISIITRFVRRKYSA